MQNPPELQAAVRRLCQSYARDKHSPSVVANKRDIRIITAYLVQLIAPAPAEDGAAELGPDASHSSLPVLPMPLASPTPPASVAATPDSGTPVPPPPASPYGAEQIIETNSKPSTTTTTTTKPPLVPPPKPVRKQRRKIRLSASQVELLDAVGAAGDHDDGAAAAAAALGAAGTEGLFDDLWAVDNQPSPKPEPKPEKAAKKKVLLAPPEGPGAIPDHEQEESMWG